MLLEDYRLIYAGEVVEIYDCYDKALKDYFEKE